jgi:hypothetical protein
MISNMFNEKIYIQHISASVNASSRTPATLRRDQAVVDNKLLTELCRFYSSSSGTFESTFRSRSFAGSSVSTPGFRFSSPMLLLRQARLRGLAMEVPAMQIAPDIKLSERGPVAYKGITRWLVGIGHEPRQPAPNFSFRWKTRSAY